MTPYEKILQMFARLNRYAHPTNKNFLYVIHDDVYEEKRYEVRSQNPPIYQVGKWLVNVKGERIGIAFNH